MNTVLTTGRLDGLVITPVVDDNGQVVSLILTVDTLPGVRVVAEAGAMAELRDAITICLGRRTTP